MPDVLKAAKKYTDEYGWVVHPLSNPNDNKNAPGKRPLMVKWSDLKHLLTHQELDKYFKNKDVNIGLVCGLSSNITIIDIDDELFQPELMAGVDTSNFIMAARTDGRGHLYFTHCNERWLRNHEYNYIKIDVRNDNDKGGGGNIVLPPSVHNSGDLYKFNKDFELSEIPEMPEQFKNNLENLINLNIALSTSAKKSRKWVRDFLLNPEILHGMDGRRCMVALCAELKANGFTSDEHGVMISKIVYQKDYDPTVASDQWGYVEPFPWKSDKLIAEFPEFCNENNTYGSTTGPIQPTQQAESLNKPPHDVKKTMTFVVVDENRFDSLLQVFGGGCKKINLNGQVFFECQDENFIKSGEANGIIRTVQVGNADTCRITTIEELLAIITKMEIKSGKHPLYYVYIGEKQLCFDAKDILNISKWREQLISSCKIVMGLRGKKTRDEFDDMLVYLLGDADTIWTDSESEDDMLASLVYEDLCNLVKVDSRHAFKRNDMSYLVEENCKMVKSSTIHQIIKNKNIGVSIQQVREVLRPRLVKNSEQVRIDGGKISIWYFKIEE